MHIACAPHPLLALRAFTTTFPVPVGDIDAAAVQPLLRPDAEAPLARDESVRQAVRDLLRHGGYKPTGRGKPASEYLVRAADAGAIGAINAAVDACNAVSLHSGLPISVIDLSRARAPFRVALAEPGEKYVFNAGGQEIDVGGLICLHDADSACANPVRDAQRTKTDATTRRTLSMVWGMNGHEARLDRAVSWYRGLLESLGGVTEAVAIR
ncbi:MAG TPA: phenylalanine--tRNA ligase beta subunit-related protein [Longimicrobiales bacterium]|nr:phenylalanine--tRNA ligase beta subunit-related protein [Longimicrobiales bacterium]